MPFGSSRHDFLQDAEQPYRLLNMSSTPSGSGRGVSVDDRTARARIRDAAVGCFAEHGIAGTTARKVAAAAGVSPGLVMHHFGSMEGLRRACDEYVTDTIRREKQRALATGPGLDVLAALRDSDAVSLMGYLARVLADDSPAVAQLVDDLVADAVDYLRQGEETGMLRPGPDRRGRAAVLTLWSLGALVLHRHLKRILGVDLVNPEAATGPAIASYLGPSYEILGEGIFTEAVAAQLSAAVAEIEGDDLRVGPATPRT